jgi:hypothetical protein
MKQGQLKRLAKWSADIPVRGFQNFPLAAATRSGLSSLLCEAALGMD